MRNHKNGFTLIEVTIVLFVVSLIIPLVFSILFSILFAQTKIRRLSEVKREGDYALSSMTYIIRNSAVGVKTGSGCDTAETSNWSNFSSATEVCGASGTSFTSASEGDDFCFENKFDKGFKFYLSSNAMASSSASLTSNVFLTSSKVQVSDFEIGCTSTGLFSAPVVSLSFTVSDVPDDTTRPGDYATLDYHTTIRLRDY